MIDIPLERFDRPYQGRSFVAQPRPPAAAIPLEVAPTSTYPSTNGQPPAAEDRCPHCGQALQQAGNPNGSHSRRRKGLAVFLSARSSRLVRANGHRPLGENGGSRQPDAENE
jgi:hypothetical protein